MNAIAEHFLEPLPKFQPKMDASCQGTEVKDVSGRIKGGVEHSRLAVLLDACLHALLALVGKGFARHLPFVSRRAVRTGMSPVLPFRP